MLLSYFGHWVARPHNFSSCFSWVALLIQQAHDSSVSDFRELENFLKLSPGCITKIILFLKLGRKYKVCKHLLKAVDLRLGRHIGIMISSNDFSKQIFQPIMDSFKILFRHSCKHMLAVLTTTWDQALVTRSISNGIIFTFHAPTITGSKPECKKLVVLSHN